jgi:hypothetical protein
LASHFADAWSERVVAEADLHLRPVAIPRLADNLRQAVFAVVPVVPAVPVKRVIVPFFPHQVIAIIVLQAAGPAARRRALGIAGKVVPSIKITSLNMAT